MRKYEKFFYEAHCQYPSCVYIQITSLRDTLKKENAMEIKKIKSHKIFSGMKCNSN